MIPIWTLKLGSVALTLASTAGFWQYVSGHVHPVRAPLKPKVERPADDTLTRQDTGWNMSGDMARPTPAPSIVKTVVVVQGPQQQVQSSAALGATWVANETGQKPVQNTRVS